ncbi:MAG: FKBP-type peptidyl-prolyl cis-trans isomerase [Pirellulales bacterium]|nr:FKBP-type peptidyl-prolyl cis-trans isomerase [Pirellulales bacterium]
MRESVLLSLVVVAVSTASVAAQESLPAGAAARPGAGAAAPTPTHHSYAIGYDLGASFRGDGIELDVEAVIAGIRDALAGAQPKYAPETLGAAMQELNARRLEILRRRNLEFLQKNQSQPGVQITRSGLQYAVLKAGDGPTPGPGDAVRAHYTGQLIDGTVFDSTQGREPAVFPVQRVIPGWTEALQKMKVGDHWRLFVPASLAYGEEGRDGIPPHATLIFEIELVEIVDQAAMRRLQE